MGTKPWGEDVMCILRIDMWLGSPLHPSPLLVFCRVLSALDNIAVDAVQRVTLGVLPRVWPF